MCGIAAYCGSRSAVPVLLDALKLLEYRGYDSCGLAVYDGKIRCVKTVGKVSELLKKSGELPDSAAIGIAHTRWATHGRVNLSNTHPHFDCKKRIGIVHNGIIENYQSLKKFLEGRGHKFRSRTDSEVIAHLFEEMLRNYPEEEAFINSVKLLEGAFAIVALHGNKLFLARKSSPLVIGIKNSEFFIASDTIAISRHTDRFIFLDDNEVGIIRDRNLEIKNLDGFDVNKEIRRIKQTEEEIDRGGFETFMLKEIFEQVETVENAYKGRIDFKAAVPVFGGIDFDKIKKFRRIVLFACGSSYNASLYAKYLFDRFFDCHVEYASEFKYADKKISKEDLLVAISQSGETIDVLEALRKYKEKALASLGIVNAVSSSIAREVDAGIYLHAGREIGVAATKTYTSQLLTLFLFWIYLARKFNYIDFGTAKGYIDELKRLPGKVGSVLKREGEIKKLARKYVRFGNALFLGRKFNYPTALEGALKLKEISYVHAEALSAGEMKHGPIALVDDRFYSVFIVPHDSITDKVVNNMQEIKARDGKIIAVTTEGRNLKQIKQLSDDIIVIPGTKEEFLPVLGIVPLQLFAYHIARLKGLDVDKPRNLAKTVTVE